MGDAFAKFSHFLSDLLAREKDFECVQDVPQLRFPRSLDGRELRRETQLTIRRLRLLSCRILDSSFS